MKDKQDELKPCPLADCQGVAQWVDLNAGPGMRPVMNKMAIVCSICGLQLHMRSQLKTLQHWNTRNDSHLRKREEDAFNAGRELTTDTRSMGYEYVDFADYEEEKRRGKK